MPSNTWFNMHYELFIREGKTKNITRKTTPATNFTGISGPPSIAIHLFNKERGERREGDAEGLFDQFSFSLRLWS